MIKHNAKVILEYSAHNSTMKVTEFEKNYLSQVRRLFEDMRFEVDVGSLEKAKLDRICRCDEEHDTTSNPTQSHLTESSVGCIVC